ncbi:MAG: four helix bundle protein [Acidobacteriota bacterium]|nr:four helix bundle protein [Acidobacteriota bacterium]
MRPHEKLQTWIESVDLVLNIYKATEKFPKEEKFGLTSQIRRAAVSIPTNIAEGAARNSSKEFAHFVSIAQGSASELETELIIAYRLGYLSETLFSKLLADLEQIGRMITGLTRRLRRVPA